MLLQCKQGVALDWVCTPKGCLTPAPAKSQGHMRLPLPAQLHCNGVRLFVGAACQQRFTPVPVTKGGRLRCCPTDGKPPRAFKDVLSSHAVSITFPHGLPVAVLQPKGQEGKDAVLAPADGPLKASVSGDEEFTISLEEPRVMESNGNAVQPAAEETPAQPASVVSLRISDVLKGTGNRFTTDGYVSQCEIRHGRQRACCPHLPLTSCTCTASQARKCSAGAALCWPPDAAKSPA